MNIEKGLEGVVLCEDNLSSCFCHEAKGHNGVHVCRCGGSWDDNHTPVTFPSVSFAGFPLTAREKELLKNKTSP